MNKSYNKIARWLGAAMVALLVQGWHCVAVAQSVPSASCVAATAGAGGAAPPCLTALVSGDSASGIYAFTGLELAAAEADDAAYANLLKLCGPGGGGCSGSQLNLFNALRQLEDNAAELLGFGESQFSLHLSAQSLGFALRWTADEEYSTQSSLTNRLASSQLDAVTNRLNAVRFLTQTLRFANRNSGDDYDDVAEQGAGRALGGGASADVPGVGTWSLFANGSYGSGSKEPTTFDDAFKFNQTQAMVGADIRPSPHTLVGLLASGMQQHADFDSTASITSGTVRGSGGGLTAYFEQDWQAAGFVNASVGAQRMSIDTRRLVSYPSNNPLLRSVNTNFLSSTNATSWLATIGAGYTFYWRAFSAEPYLSGQYMGTRIGAFTESGSGTNPELALRVAGQSVTSLQSIVGLRFQYALPSRFGVLLPYATGEFRHEFRDKSETVNSQYINSQPILNQFQLPTDSIDPNYFQVGGGLLTVLPHRVQLYAQYMKVPRLQFYSYYAVSAGLRFQL
jgi:uncharacterized protein YhjY with autotransporter beta-barrel domain